MSRRAPSCLTRPSTCRLALIRRTVWDGSQELYEIQMPGSDADALENDTAAVNRSGDPSLAFWDAQAYFGRVAYTHGPDVDRPLSVMRVNYTDAQSGTFGTPAPREVWKPFSMSVIWNMRGQAEAGLFSEGTSWHLNPDDGTRSARIFFPGGWFPYSRPFDLRQSWMGTLLEDKQDKSGLNYRRNRQYDPNTGRFTQEDPIGLAGGMNLYGFAGGDPVNFSDPMGLCPVTAADPTPCGLTGAAIGTVAGAVLGTAISGGCASVTVGICAAAAPMIIGASAGLGGAVGGFLGTANEMAPSDALAATSVEMGRIGNKIRSAAAGVGLRVLDWIGGQAGSPPTPPTPTTQEEKEKQKPKKDAKPKGSDGAP